MNKEAKLLISESLSTILDWEKLKKTGDLTNHEISWFEHLLKKNKIDLKNTHIPVIEYPEIYKELMLLINDQIQNYLNIKIHKSPSLAELSKTIIID
ncbi:hypothetical protein, partial [Okeania sp. SIO2B9]|uniref:hypothetical protein n=1 Tax=Okeania sp. SIO2B9 TaxID=2607782 RepID=UPI00142B08FD